MKGERNGEKNWSNFPIFKYINCIFKQGRNESRETTESKQQKQNPPPDWSIKGTKKMPNNRLINLRNNPTKFEENIPPLDHSFLGVYIIPHIADFKIQTAPCPSRWA